MKLIIAYDGSDDARRAIRAAGRLFNGSQAVVVHVWQSLAGLLLHGDLSSFTGPIQEAADELDAADREEAERTTAEGATLARELGLDAEESAVEGHPMAWSAVLGAGDSHDADVIVVGSRGLSGIKAIFLGSSSAGVLHHSTRPVLIAPPRDDVSSGGEGPVLIGYDGSDHAKRAIEASGRLLPGRSAIVASIWTSYQGMGRAAVLGAPAGVTAAALEKLDADAAAKARDTSSEGADLAKGAGFDAEPIDRQAHGNVWATLASLAGENGVCAVVVGSRGRSTLGEAILGSVTRGLVHHAQAPVLVIPPGR